MGAALGAAPRTRRYLFPQGATFFAVVGFLVLIVGITYFAMLVRDIRFGEPDRQAAAYVDLGRYLSGRFEWYQNARVFSGVALLCALLSTLFGAHALARITLPVAGVSFVLLLFWSESIWRLLSSWAQTVG